jgi:hypothetical protein
VQLGGADVLTYREMMSRHARLAGRPRRPLIEVPMPTPRLSSYWVALVTPVPLGLVKPAVEGPGAPPGFDAAVRAARS